MNERIKSEKGDETMKRKSNDTVYLYRGTERRLRVPNATIKADGSIWCGAAPALDGEAMAADGADRAAVIAAIKRRDYSGIAASWYVRMSAPKAPGGIEGVREAEALRRDAAAKRAAEEAMSPADRERREIERLRNRAERLAESDSEDNVSGPMRLRAEADRRMAAWRKAYPDEARAEEAGRLERLAVDEDRLAAGAATYDADGWLSEADREERAAGHRATAAEYRERAAALRQA